MKKSKIIFIIIVMVLTSIHIINYSQSHTFRLYLLAQNNEDINYIYLHHREIPDELIELVISNQETVEFVKGYLQHHPLSHTIGKIKGIPLLLQWDKRWGYCKYGKQMLAINGCGPTCLSMVASYLNNDNTMTPYVISKYAYEKDYYIEGKGTKWSLMTIGCQHFGIEAKWLVLSKETVMNELDNNHPIICSVRKGNFTSSGHFIVIVNYQNGLFKVHDPNSIQNSQLLWKWETLEKQIKCLWSYKKS